MKKICKRQAEGEKLAKENKEWSAVKEKPTAVCPERTYWVKQSTEVPNIFSRNSEHQETLNEIKSLFKRANV